MKKTAFALLVSATALTLVGCQQEAAEPAVEVTEEVAVEAPVEEAVEVPVDGAEAPVDGALVEEAPVEEAPVAE